MIAFWVRDFSGSDIVLNFSTLENTRAGVSIGPTH